MPEENKKKTSERNYWPWLLFFLFWLLLFPYILNNLISGESYWEVVGGPEEWLAFWPSYLSALASTVMIAHTAKTLNNNKSQLDELKRQWDEEHKPDVSVSYSMIDHIAYLRLVNTSKSEIYNLRISGEFYVNEKKNNYFDLSILEQFNINIESHGIRNIIIHPKIEPLSHDCYFILKLRYNNTIEKEVKVYCNYIYSIGDDIIWSKMFDAINKITK